MESRSVMTVINLGDAFVKSSFWLVLDRKAEKDVPESWRLEFSEKISMCNFSYEKLHEDNTSRLWNRGEIVRLRFLSTLLEILQKLQNLASED